jgi:molybdopterin converting factor small subunit
VRYFAAARAAAGVTEEKAEAVSLDALVGALSAVHGDELAKIFKVASFLVDGLVWRDHEGSLPTDATVDVLPPFAGG